MLKAREQELSLLIGARAASASCSEGSNIRILPRSGALPSNGVILLALYDDLATDIFGRPKRPYWPMFENNGESCSVCGGDGRIGNSMGDTKTCPSCRGSGRRSEDNGWHDATKTKPSHYKNSNGVQKPAVAVGPKSTEGIQLAVEVRDSKVLTAELKAQLILEIAAYEVSHGHCTRTFSKKIRKQLKPSAE